MKTLFTAQVKSKGGRSGSLEESAGLLSLTLGNPLVEGEESRGPNPEMLFAGAYAACYHGAVRNAAKTLNIPLGDSSVRALVSLLEDDAGGYRLAVELHAHLSRVQTKDAERVMAEAHRSCPYSKALRGDTAVTLVLDTSDTLTPAAQTSHEQPRLQTH